MQNEKKVIADGICTAAEKLFAGCTFDSSQIADMLEYPPDPTMGDIALPCFKLSKTCRRSPIQIATSLADALHVDCCSNVKAINGYLNFSISPDHLARQTLDAIKAQGESYGSPHCGNGKTVVLDYSSPNIAKPFHIGHLGTTIIGHSLRKLHEFAGYKCIGINHLGDWGTQFGKLIVAYNKWGCREDIEKGGIDKLVELYVRINKEIEENPSLADEARHEFKKLEEHDPANTELWKWFIDISLEEYAKTYRQLDVEFDSYLGESFYPDKMPAQIQKLRDMGLLKIDNGASLVDLSEYDMPPCLILKSDGTTLYPTRDIAAAVYRHDTYNFDKAIYVTSSQQSLYFCQLFKVIELMGYNWYDKLVHVPYGTVSINGAKLATRTGNVILLKDLLAMAIEKVSQITLEKNPDISDEKRERIAEDVGVGAIVFYYLSNSRIKDINFMLDDALSYDGNTGPYVQYTYARACSVLSHIAPDTDFNAYTVTTDEEKELVKELAVFPEKVSAALDAYEPSIVTRYILDLAAAFNRFYHNCQILNADTEEIKKTRVCLTDATRTVLGIAFGLICLKKTQQI